MSVVVSAPAGNEYTNADVEPPLAPTGVSLSAQQASQIQVNWLSNSEPDLANYRIYKSTTSGLSGFSVLATVPSATVNYVDSTFSESVQSWYKMTALDGAGNESEFSSVVSSTVVTGNPSEWVTPIPDLTYEYSEAVSQDLSLYASNPGTYSVVTGSLPAGLSLSPSTGLLSGTTGTSAEDQAVVFGVTNGIARDLSFDHTTSGSIAPYELPSPQNGTFVFEFNVAPVAASVDLVCALSFDQPGDYDDMSCIVRLNTSGQFDARNGGNYQADNTINYIASTSYSVVVTVTLATQTYSVTVDGAVLAQDYAFRTTAPTTVIDHFSTVDNSTVGSSVDTVSMPGYVANEQVQITVFEADAVPPSSPTGLAVVSSTSSSVSLNWDDNSESDLSHYTVYRSTDDVNFTAISTNVPASTDVDGTVSASTLYYYRVTATDLSGNESAQSSSVSVTTADAGAWPKLARTDVGASGSLTTYTGNSTLSTPGQTFTNMAMGSVTIDADDLTFTNCTFTGTFGSTTYVCRADRQNGGLTFEDCTFTGGRSALLIMRLAKGGNVVRRCRFEEVYGDHVKLFVGEGSGGAPVDILFESCWFGLLGTNISGIHADSFQCQNYDNSTTTVRGCTFQNGIGTSESDPLSGGLNEAAGGTSYTPGYCFFAQKTNSTSHTIIIEDCYINGANHSVAVNSEILPDPIVRNCKFGLDCRFWLFYAGYGAGASTFNATNNTWEVSGVVDGNPPDQPINPSDPRYGPWTAGDQIPDQ